MNPLLALCWHFAGLLSAAIGAYMIWGWSAILIVIGAWLVFGTSLDIIVKRLEGLSITVKSTTLRNP